MADRDDNAPESGDDPLPPHYPQDAGDAEHVEAMLSLSSRAPQSLDARVASRRESGDHVLVPVPENENLSAHERGTMVLRYLLPLGIAAAAALAFFLLPGTDDRTVSDRQFARRDSSVSATVADSINDSPFRKDSSQAGSARPSITVPERNDIALGYSGTRQPVFAARMRDFREAVVDSAANATLRDSSFNVVISHPAGNVELAALAKRIGQAMATRGVKLTAVHIEEGGVAVSISAVTIQVRPPDRIR